MPLEAEKGRKGTPLTKIEKNAIEVKFMIQLTQVRSKPKARRVALR